MAAANPYREARAADTSATIKIGMPDFAIGYLKLWFVTGACECLAWQHHETSGEIRKILRTGDSDLVSVPDYGYVAVGGPQPR
ncbi:MULTISPECIES: hypothetical protein [unclassified Bradyrhizobium]